MAGKGAIPRAVTFVGYTSRKSCISTFRVFGPSGQCRGFARHPLECLGRATTRPEACQRNRTTQTLPTICLVDKCHLHIGERASRCEHSKNSQLSCRTSEYIASVGRYTDGNARRHLARHVGRLGEHIDRVPGCRLNTSVTDSACNETKSCREQAYVR